MADIIEMDEGTVVPVETIEEWAARVAPTLTADGWRRAERVAAGGSMDEAWDASKHPNWYYEQARALLAYRNEVAEGLTPAQRLALVQATTDVGYLPYGSSQRRCGYNLRDKHLVFEGVTHWSGLTATDFGREIARTLTEGVSRG